jgi:hypothetical protein
MKSPSEQVSEGQPRATELLIKPDAEIVQSHPRRQTCSQSLKLMRPLPPQAKGVEQLVVGALYDLANGGYPPHQALGPGLDRVSFGRMDDARPVALSPAAVVLGSFETFVGYVGSRGDRSYTGKASVRLIPHSKESLKAICWSALEAAPKQKPVMTPVGSVAVSREKPVSTIPGCWTIRCRPVQQAIHVLCVYSLGWASPSCPAPRKDAFAPQEELPGARRKPP